MLLDVGVWLAAVWAGHVHHPVAAEWFERRYRSITVQTLT